MKTISIVIVLMISYLNILSQKPINAQLLSPDAKVRNELLQNIQSFTEAWGNSDTTVLSRLLAKEYRHTDIWGKILHREDWLTYAAMPRKISNIVTTDTEILLYNNLAAVTGKMAYEYGTEKLIQEIRFTQLWSRNNGQWKRTTFHATLIDKSK